MKKYLTIDVGGSSIKYALVDESLTFLEKGKVKNTFENLDQFTDAIKEIYEKYADGVEGMACSMPGVIDPDTGYFYSGGSYDAYIHEINLIDELHKKIDCKISIANDAKCAANAELGYGCLKDVNNAVVIVLGTGIGGCVILDHKVLNGKNFSAGEFSFISCDTTNEFTFPNAWGKRNGSSGLLGRVNEALGEETKMDGIQIFERANAGDENVLAGVREFSRELANQIYNLQIILDPEKFAIGGGISEQPLLMKLLDEELDKLNTEITKYGRIMKPNCVTCKYNNDANLIGALYHFTTKFE